VTSPFGRSSRASARRTRIGLTGLVTIALLLCVPAPGIARDREAQTERGESFATALSSAGLLSRGAGYGSPGGSKLVRGLQSRLRELGHEPGPVDGLLGPRTEGAILHFQRAQGLAVDGVVGPQTKASLVGRRAERPDRTSKPRAERQPADAGEPKPSAGPSPSANPNQAPGPSPSAKPSAGPKPSAPPAGSGGIAPVYAALLGALAAGVVLVAVRAVTGRRARRLSVEPRAESPVAGATSVNVGVACAALLGVFAAGAAGGAAFATRAAPDAPGPVAPDRDVSKSAPLGTGSAAAARQPQSQRPPTRSRKAKARRSTSPTRPSRSARRKAQTPETVPSASAARSVAPPVGPIAEEQPPLAPAEQTVRRRARITPLKRDRVASGHPDVIAAGKLRPR
jgi:peptidoglycan hydrolase-like protein with peptidoglycan-binding domain